MGGRRTISICLMFMGAIVAIRISLFVLLSLLCVHVVAERPRPNVITGGNPDREDVPWPEEVEYRNTPSTPQYRSNRGYTPEYRPRQGYHKRYPSCTACRYSFHYVYNPKATSPAPLKNPITGKAYYDWHDYMRSMGVKFNGPY